MGKRKVAPHERTFTRSELLALLTLEPCHVTGEHDPTHTPRYVCSIQMTTALGRLLRELGVAPEELPRKLHAERCYFCHDEGARHKQEFAAWAGGKPLEPRR